MNGFIFAACLLYVVIDLTRIICRRVAALVRNRRMRKARGPFTTTTSLDRILKREMVEKIVAASLITISLVACGDDLTPPTHEPNIYAVRACHEFAHDTSITIPVDVQEVRLDAYPFYTYAAPSWVAADGASTWTQAPREWQGHLGSWGVRVYGTDRCIWLDAIEAREVATGEP